jgi:teichuronic acid biosynthesis protein TuaE
MRVWMLDVRGTFPIVNELPWLKKLWVVLVFLFLLGGGLFEIPFGEFHITPFRILMPIFLYIFLLTFFLYGKIRLNSKVGLYQLFLALWLLWEVVSIFWASAYIGTARSIEALVSGILLITFSLLFLNTERGIRSIYGLWLVFAVISIGVGIWESQTGMHLSSSNQREVIQMSETFPTGFFYNSNDFATFLTLSFPFMFTALRFLKGAFLKVLGVVAISASFYLIILTSSRANIIAVLIGICLLFVLPGVRARIKSVATPLAIGGLIMLVGFAFSVPVISSFTDSLGTIPQQILSVNPGEKSVAIRMDLIRDGLVWLQNSHFLGGGGGSFVYWGTTNPHDWWLEILVDYGVVIFALFLVFYLGLLWNLFRIFHSSENQTLKVVALATFISLVEFSVGSTSSSGLIGAIFVWFLFATALCIISCYRLKEKGVII